MVIQALFKFLEDNNMTISVAESMTSGNLQRFLTSNDGSSKYFEGGITAYNINQKVKHLKVNHKIAEPVDCVSQEVADQMALGVSRMFETRMSVSTTGYVDKNMFFSVCIDNEIVLRGEVDTSKYRNRNESQKYSSIDIMLNIHEFLKNKYNKINYMKITDLVDWKELLEDFGTNLESEEDFMEFFELDGKIMMQKEFQEYKYNGKTQLDLGFYCGPSIGNYGVSDSVHIDEYLSKICKDLNINCDIGASENYHILYGFTTIQSASIAFDKIKDCVSKDFEVEIKPYYTVE